MSFLTGTIIYLFQDYKGGFICTFSLSIWNSCRYILCLILAWAQERNREKLENSSMTSFLLSNGVKAFNKGKVVISSELIPAKNTDGLRNLALSSIFETHSNDIRIIVKRFSRYHELTAKTQGKGSRI